MENNTNPIYTINPLFDFQCLSDTDLGLYRLIKKEYYDRSVFKNELFDSNDEVFIRTELLCRQNLNPLFIFCKENIMSDEELDDLYEQFLTEEYDKILKLSPITSIMNVASTSNNVRDLVNVSILCKSEEEKKWINKYTNKLNCIISDYNQFNLRRYDTIYIKDIYTLLLYHTLFDLSRPFSNLFSNLFSNFFECRSQCVFITDSFIILPYFFAFVNRFSAYFLFLFKFAAF